MSERRFSLGDEVANFSPGAAADALVFVRANGVIETSGKKAFVVITGMGIAYNRVALDISVVDAQTGSVLYFAKPASGGDFVGKPDSMKEPIDRSFSDFRLQYPPKNKSSLLVQIPASHRVKLALVIEVVCRTPGFITVQSMRRARSRVTGHRPTTRLNYCEFPELP